MDGKDYKPLLWILLLASIFGIAQPFIWRVIFSETPPQSAVTLSILLTVVLAILGLGGFALYIDVRGRLSKEMSEKLMKERGTAHQEFEEARKEITEKCEEYESLLMSRIHGRISYIETEHYEEELLSFLQKKENANVPFENPHLEWAIKDDRRALSWAIKLPTDIKEYGRVFLKARNDLTYDLAIRRHIDDKDEVSKLARELYEEANKPEFSDVSRHLKDTYALAVWRFAEDEIQENEAKRVLQELIHDPHSPYDWRQKLKQKYKILL